MTENELKLISYLARDGMSLDKIRKTLGIKRAKWNRFLKEKPEEKRRLELLRHTTDYAVEDALLKRALGYISEEHKETEKPNGTEQVTTHKEVPPDVRAAVLWLKCRRSDVWDEKHSEPENNDISGILEELDKEAENEDE